MEIYVLDWIINKPIKIFGAKKVDLKPGEKILYTFKNEDGNIETNIGIVLGYSCDSEKSGKFKSKLEGQYKEKFDILNKKAGELFEIFKKDFNSFFNEAVPITARFTWNGKKIYFYFYSEERLDFREFLKLFRPKIGIPFFLYQVGARDWIRLDPRSEGMYGCCGERPLCCVSYKCPLPPVETDLVILENLAHRGIDKLRGRCGKLKCCLNYERRIYEEEAKKYPKIGEEFIYDNKKFVCKSFNIMTGMIVAKDEEGNTVYIDKKEIDDNLGS